MFAVIILGIGFIMVAGIFPVSLQQARLSSEEIAGAAVARGAVAVLGEVLFDNATATDSNAVARGRVLGTVVTPSEVGPLSASPKYDIWDNVSANVVPANPAGWTATLGNMVVPHDPRFAWTALYRREGNPADVNTWAPYAQVYVFALVNRNSAQFQVGVDGRQPGGNVSANPLPNLQPKPIRVAVLDDVLEAGGVDLIAIRPEGPQDYTGAAVEGAYVVICRDQISGPGLQHVGRMNGRMFRLGTRRDDLTGTTGPFGAMTQPLVFELQPGGDFVADPGLDGILFDPLIPATAGYEADDIRAIGMAAPNPQGSTVTYNALALAAIVGAGYSDAAAGGEFAGPSMVVSAYTGVVKINR